MADREISADGLASALQSLPVGDPPGIVQVQPSLWAAVPDPDAVGDDRPGVDAGEPRGAGRPPGARNKSTEDWRQFLLSRYRSPLLGAAEICNTHPVQLAKDLGIKPYEALQAWMTAARFLASYTHSKMPLALEIKDERTVTFQFMVGEKPAAGAEPGRLGGIAETFQPMIDDASPTDSEVQQYQRFSRAVLEASDLDAPDLPE